MNKKTFEDAYRKIAAAKKGSRPEYTVIRKDGKPVLVFEVETKKEG